MSAKTKVKRVPFTFASSPLSESLEQARVASGALSDPVEQGNGVDEAVRLFLLFSTCVTLKPAIYFLHVITELRNKATA